MASRESVVLIADDDPHSIDLVYHALSSEDLELTVANDAKGTLTAAASGRPDIILLDLLMEGIDGFETCRRLKANPETQDIPVLFMSSCTEVSARVQAFRLGGVDYIVKPFEPEELIGRVRTHLALRSVTKSLKEQNARLERQIRERRDAEAAREAVTGELMNRTEELRLANAQLSSELVERERAEFARAALQEQLLVAHQQRLRELSTPLMPIGEKVIIMPLIGAMDVARAEQVLESALEGTTQRGAEFVILDVTGLKGMDSGVADLLIRASQGLRLLGARVIITGIRPEVARELVGLGVSLDKIATKATLQDGVAHVMQISGGAFGMPLRRKRASS